MLRQDCFTAPRSPLQLLIHRLPIRPFLHESLPDYFFHSLEYRTNMALVWDLNHMISMMISRTFSHAYNLDGISIHSKNLSLDSTSQVLPSFQTQDMELQVLFQESTREEMMMESNFINIFLMNPNTDCVFPRPFGPIKVKVCGSFINYVLFICLVTLQAY